MYILSGVGRGYALSKMEVLVDLIFCYGVEG